MKLIMAFLLLPHINGMQKIPSGGSLGVGNGLGGAFHGNSSTPTKKVLEEATISIAGIDTGGSGSELGLVDKDDADVNFSSATGGGYCGSGLVVADQVLGDHATTYDGGSYGVGGLLLPEAVAIEYGNLVEKKDNNKLAEEEETILALLLGATKGSDAFKALPLMSNKLMSEKKYKKNNKKGDKLLGEYGGAKGNMDMADNKVLSLAAGDSGGYGRRDWAAVAAGLGVEVSVESEGVVISGDGNGGRLLPLCSDEVEEVTVVSDDGTNGRDDELRGGDVLVSSHCDETGGVAKVHETTINPSVLVAKDRMATTATPRRNKVLSVMSNLLSYKKSVKNGNEKDVQQVSSDMVVRRRDSGSNLSMVSSDVVVRCLDGGGYLPMLSSILFQDLGEKAGSFKCVTQNEGYTQTPDDLNDYSLEEEQLVGGEVEKDAFEGSEGGESSVAKGYALKEENLLMEFPLSNSWSFHFAGVGYQDVFVVDEEEEGGREVLNSAEEKEVVPMMCLWYHHSIFLLIGVLIVLGAAVFPRFLLTGPHSTMGTFSFVEMSMVLKYASSLLSHKRRANKDDTRRPSNASANGLAILKGYYVLFALLSMITLGLVGGAEGLMSGSGGDENEEGLQNSKNVDLRRNFADNFAAATPSQIYLTHTQDDSSTNEVVSVGDAYKPTGVQKGENLSPSRRLRRIGLKDTAPTLKETEHKGDIEGRLRNMLNVNSTEIKHAKVEFVGVTHNLPNYQRLLDDINPKVCTDRSTSFTLSNGATFTWEIDGCCCVQLTECIPSDRDDFSEVCKAGVKGSVSDYNKVGDAPTRCYLSTCNVKDQSEFARQAFDGTCRPDIGFYSTEFEVPDGIDNDCDGFVDDEQCDGIDNDGDGIVDEDRGSCLLKILAFPMDWEGSLASYEDFVNQAFTQFIAQSGVTACSDNFLLDIRTDNIIAPASDEADGGCTGCGLGTIKSQMDTLLTPQERVGYDVIAAFTNRDICGSTAGCNGGREIWIEVKKTADTFPYQFAIKDSVFSHEIGHTLGLDDQYCSQLTWTGPNSPEPRCSPRTNTPNPLSTDLGCDPTGIADDCCDNCNDYAVCCKGNKSADGQGRSIMSSAGDVSHFPKGWDAGELAYIKDFTNGRTALNTLGKIVMDCEYVFEGIRMLMVADATIDPTTGGISVSKAWSGMGRPSPGGSNDSSLNYCVQVMQGGNMVGELFFDLETGYTGPQYKGIDYSDLDFTSGPLLASLTIPTSAISLSPADPVQFMAMLNNVPVSSSCVTPGSDGSLEPDTSPPAISGCDDTTAECSAFGGTLKNDAQLTSFFNSVVATDSCDPNPSVTNDAPQFFISRKTTKVVFTAQDSDDNTATCSANVEIVDTTLPIIDLINEETVVHECGPEFTDAGASAVDICDGDLSDFIITSDDVTGNKEGTVGSYSITYDVADVSDNDAFQAVRTVNVVDTTDPTINVGQESITLWPPNGKYLKLDIVSNFTVTIDDICCGADGSLAITSVSSNEDATGKKSEKDDIYIVNATSFMARVQRDGNGDGRVYTIDIDATDCNNQVASAQVFVNIPHDQSAEEPLPTEESIPEDSDEEDLPW